MKTIALLTVSLAFFLADTRAEAHSRRAACVGGPRAASYAFNDWNNARRCAQAIARQSRECAQAVRTRECQTEGWNVDTVNPDACLCNPGGAAIGVWD